MRTIKDLQLFLGVKVDGVWGPKSQAALDLVLHPSMATGNYSTRFLLMIPFLWEWEGTTFENDPSDPGGATKYGIDQRSHPNENIRELTEARAIQIYWESYWQDNKCEEAGFPMGEVIFNCAVNMGKGRVREIMAKIGPMSSANDFLNQQEAIYRRIATANPKLKKFLQGWLNRTAALRKHLRLDA